MVRLFLTHSGPFRAAIDVSLADQCLIAVLGAKFNNWSREIRLEKFTSLQVTFWPIDKAE